MQILYSILNSHDDIYCERVFGSGHGHGRDDEKGGKGAFTLETFTPVKELDMLGLYSQYELSYTNVLNMLELGGIPLRREERDDSWPVIVGGGPCAFNPEPLADFSTYFS